MKETIKLVDVKVDPVDCCDSVCLIFDYDRFTNLGLLALYRSPSNDAKSFIGSINNWIRNFSEGTIFANVGDFNICR